MGILKRSGLCSGSTVMSACTWLLLSCVAAGQAFAQTPSIRFSSLSLEDGLSQATVTAVVQDPAGFISAFTESDETLRQQVMQARQRLEDVLIPTATIDRAVAIATAAKVQGHRAELALVRSARALVALLDRDSVTIPDLHEVAGFALAHRIPGPTVLSQEDVYAQLPELATAPLRDAAFDQDPGQGDDQIYLMENVDFPGSAAAGSSLFTYLKKKLKTASSLPTNPLT